MGSEKGLSNPDGTKAKYFLLSVMDTTNLSFSNDSFVQRYIETE